MSNTHETVRKPGRSLKEKIRIAEFVTMANLALAASVATPAAKAERSTPTKTNTAQLRDPHELPGLKTHLSQERLDELKASTVELGVKLKTKYGGSEQTPYEPLCTAVKVTLPGHEEPYIMTAAHCFGGVTGIRSGVFTDSLRPQNPAEDFTKVSAYKFAILDPQADRLTRIGIPVATVDRLLIDTSNKDVALLHPHVKALPQKGPLNVRSFDTIPAIPLKVAEQAPLQGTPVALYGEPQANDFEPIAGTGVYLGRVLYEPSLVPGGRNIEGSYRQLDLVGISPDTPQTDNCNYGTSGSMALLPNGELLGNLTIRSNGGYGLDKIIQYPDSLASDEYWRTLWAQQLDVNLDGFATICGYTVMDSQTPNDLLDGVNHEVIPVKVDGKGGDPNGLH